MKDFDLVELKREIFVLNSQINRFDNKHLSDLGLSVSQTKIIFLLSVSGRKEVYSKDIDACLGTTHSSTSGILMRMQKKGFIQFTTSQVDKRCKAITLTPKGKELFLHIVEFANVQQKLIDNIPLEDLQITCNTLRAMIKNIK